MLRSTNGSSFQPYGLSEVLLMIAGPLCSYAYFYVVFSGSGDPRRRWMELEALFVRFYLFLFLLNIYKFLVLSTFLL